MLPKKNRLTYNEFQQNPNTSFHYNTKLIHVVRKITTGKIPRFVIIVPKRLEKKTVTRHQIRRILIELIRSIMPKIQNPFDFLVKPKKIFTKDMRVNIGKDLERMLI